MKLHPNPLIIRHSSLYLAVAMMSQKIGFGVHDAKRLITLNDCTCNDMEHKRNRMIFSEFGTIFFRHPYSQFQMESNAELSNNKTSSELGKRYFCRRSDFFSLEGKSFPSCASNVESIASDRCSFFF